MESRARLLFSLLLMGAGTKVCGGDDSAKTKHCVYSFDLERNQLQIACGASIRPANFSLRGLHEKAERLYGSHGGARPLRRSRAGADNGTTTVLNSTEEFLDIEDHLNRLIGDLNNVTSALEGGGVDFGPSFRRAGLAARDDGQEALWGVVEKYRQSALAGFGRLTASVASLTRLVRRLTTDLAAASEDHRRSIQSLSREVMALSHLGGRRTALQEKCQQGVGAIGQRVNFISMGVDEGTVMKDVAGSGSKIWIMYGYGGSNQLIEFESERSFRHELVSKTYELPFYCEGTGHVIYRNSLHCLKSKTNNMMKFDLDGSAYIVEQPLEDAGVHDVYPYQPGRLSDVDFAVDENGLWVVYATESSNGNMVVSKLNEDDLSVRRTWRTGYPKKLVIDTFMVCGVLYGVESTTTSPPFVRYKYDTNSERDSVLGPNDIVFSTFTDDDLLQISMMDYNILERSIYTWNDARVEIYPVYFRASRYDNGDN